MGGLSIGFSRVKIMNNHRLLSRKAIKLPETGVILGQALVGAEWILLMHDFELIWHFLSILLPLLGKNRVEKVLRFIFFAKNSYKFTSNWLC